MISGSARTLIELTLVATAIGGILYGLHWRSKAGNDSKNLDNDRQVLELYRKLEQVEAVNDSLLRRIAELENPGSSLDAPES